MSHVLLPEIPRTLGFPDPRLSSPPPCPPSAEPHQLTELHNQQEGKCLYTDAQALEDVGVLQAPGAGVGRRQGQEPRASIPPPQTSVPPQPPSHTRMSLPPVWSRSFPPPDSRPHPHTHAPSTHTLLPQVPISGLSASSQVRPLARGRCLLALLPLHLSPAQPLPSPQPGWSLFLTSWTLFSASTRPPCLRSLPCSLSLTCHAPAHSPPAPGDKATLAPGSFLPFLNIASPHPTLCVSPDSQGPE